MKRLLIGLTVAAGAVVLPAHLAGATDGDLTFRQNCDAAIVVVTSHYAEGVIHVNIDAPVNGGGDVAPLETKEFPFGWNGMNTMHVVVSSSNGHLNGKAPGATFDHTFHLSENCTTPTTPVPTTPPTTTCEQAIPGRADCTGPTVPPVATTVGPCVTAPVQGQPGWDPCGDCNTTPEICAGFLSSTTTSAAPPAVAIQQGPPRTTPHKLPATGAGDVAIFTGAGVLLIITGVILRRQCRKTA